MQIVFMTEIGLDLSPNPLVFAERILIFGLPLFGFWLPYIGFTSFYLSDDTGEEVEAKCFLVEFLLLGVFLVYDVLEIE